ncbi:MAG TPA: hypothetical protein VK749_07660 [Xanthobacteraceae bacterium]|nr:hypothetical protein [Xanthobacteraceae bacterium]
MSALTDSTFWLAVLTVAAIAIVTATVVLLLRRLTLELLHRLEAKFVALAPAPLGGRTVGLLKFFYVAALFCGITAFVLSMSIWRAPWPPGGVSDPILWNPLFWLTWLAVMTAIMLCGIVGGVLARTALALGLVRLRKALAREGR